MLLVLGNTPQGRMAAEVCEQAGKPFYYATPYEQCDMTMHNGQHITGLTTHVAIEHFCQEHDVRCIIDASQPACGILVSQPSHTPVIRVTGRHGLRRAIEQIVPEFFPLRTGFTTGACATAACKAALLCILEGEQVSEVGFSLPDGEVMHISVDCVERIDEHTASATVTKDFSDDPDVTKGCRITVQVELENENHNHNENQNQNENYNHNHNENQNQNQNHNDNAPCPPSSSKELSSNAKAPTPTKANANAPTPATFLRGPGVGLVTLPGLGIPVGGPAINPTPRQMMLNELHQLTNRHARITVSVEGGEALARQTFNPKVGVVDGISIIGTSGIVSPLSNEAFVQSIRRELEVARAIGCTAIGLASGKRGEDALHALEPSLRVIHYGNFIGAALQAAHELGFVRAELGIMIGKAVKLAEGHLDTHSHKVTMNKDFLRQVALDCGLDDRLLDDLTMARELWQRMPTVFFDRLRMLCQQHCLTVFPSGELNVHLICDTPQS